MENRVRVYRCYSNNLKEFLMSKGFEYIDIAKDHRTDKTFWMFLKCEGLDKALTEWTNSKPSK